MLTLLQTEAAGYAGANPFVFGGLALLGLLIGLFVVLAMGMGRPHSK